MENLDILRENLIKQLGQAYKVNDPAHQTNHFEEVFQTALILNKELNAGFSERLLMIAAYTHDLFAWSRFNHHELSWHYVLTTDLPIIQELEPISKELVAYACLEHRASYKGKFSSKFSELFNAADRERPKSVNEILKRSFIYNRHKNPELTEHEALINAIKHCSEKFGVNGYARFPNIYEQVFGNNLANIREKMDEQVSLINDYKYLEVLLERFNQ